MMDQFFFAYTGIAATDFLNAVRSRNADSEMLVWVMEHLQPRRTPAEITQWSSWFEAQGPMTAARHAWLSERIKQYGPAREDIQTWCEHLDLDDYVAFGGKA